MGVFCDRLKSGSTAALNCLTGQNKGRYCKKKALIAQNHFVHNYFRVKLTENFILQGCCVECHVKLSDCEDTF